MLHIATKRYAVDGTPFVGSTDETELLSKYDNDTRLQIMNVDEY